MRNSILEKHIKPENVEDNLSQTSIKITKEQKKFLEENRINLSSLVRELLDRELLKNKSGPSSWVLYFSHGDYYAWDSEVESFVEDGFKTYRQSWHEALCKYATERKLRAIK